MGLGFSCHGQVGSVFLVVVPTVAISVSPPLVWVSLAAATAATAATARTIAGTLSVLVVVNRVFAGCW